MDNNKDECISIGTFCKTYQSKCKPEYARQEPETFNKTVRRHIEKLFGAWDIKYREEIASKYGRIDDNHYQISKNKAQFLFDSLKSCKTKKQIKKKMENTLKYKIQVFEFIEDYSKINFYKKYDKKEKPIKDLYENFFREKREKFEKELRECKECMDRMLRADNAYAELGLIIFNAMDAKFVRIQKLLVSNVISNMEETVNAYYEIACLFEKIDEDLRDVKKVKDAMKVAMKYSEE